MKSYQIVLFDLDGTLTDPKEGITKSVQYALEKMGIIEPDLRKLEPFIGPPLQETFVNEYGMDNEQANAAIQFYRERFKAKGMFENKLYPGIIELLMQLKEQNKILIVATSKPTVFAEQILQFFNLHSYFDLVIGSNLDGTRSTKTEIIQYILDQYPKLDRSEFIMIGDRKHDIIGATNTGIHSIGVTYGYGSIEEITPASPTYVVRSIEELSELWKLPTR